MEEIRARSKVEDERERKRKNERRKTKRAMRPEEAADARTRVQVRDLRVKDGTDFGNAGLYAANNQCILSLSLSPCAVFTIRGGRLHRDKCKAAGPTYIPLSHIHRVFVK